LVMAPCFTTTAYLLDSSRPTGNLIILDPDLRRHDPGAGRRRDRRPVRWRGFIGLKVAVLDNLEQCPIEFRADPQQWECGRT
jgi:hypothetical protein